VCGAVYIVLFCIWPLNLCNVVGGEFVVLCCAEWEVEHPLNIIQ